MFVGLAFFVISPELAFLAFLPIPVIVIGSLLYQKKLEPRYDAVRAAAGRIADTLTNNLGGIATIKAFTAEEREVERVADRQPGLRRGQRQSHPALERVHPAHPHGDPGRASPSPSSSAVAPTLNGTLEVGLYATLVYMTQRLLWPLTELGETLDLYQRAMASCRRIFGLLTVEPSIQPGHPRPAARRCRAPCASTTCPSPTPPDGDVLHDLDFEIPAGETHAIVGATGSGKSTVVKLLLRLYEPTRGQICIDGVPIDELTYRSLRGSMGFVSQDVFLFQGTVRENLTYGRPDATDAELEWAARLAEAHDFVVALPDGYDTIVGERGQKLSGGQRQRLTIARAIVRDPAILVLDEATSAVDNETEAAIQRSIAHVSADRTTIVIAHRLSTVRHAHRIHVLEAGRIIEAGTHEELVDHGGLYAALWRVQTGEATDADAAVID